MKYLLFLGRLKKNTLILFFLALVSTTLQSCTPNQNKNNELNTYFISPSQKNTLNIYDLADPPTLDPARSWGFLDGRLIGLVFSNLVRFDHHADLQPDLAIEWQISPDGRSYRFNLNPKAVFSHGQPVTAEDVKYSFHRIMDPNTASPTSWIFDQVSDIKEINKNQLTITLKQPYAPFLQMLAMPGASIVPKNIIHSHKNAVFGENPIGSGPWQFKEWKHDRHLLFARNENYWKPKPRMKFLKMRIVSNPFTAIAEFETGRVALIEPLPIAEILRWKTHPQWNQHVTKTPLLETDMLLFNCERPLFQSQQVREAICHILEPNLTLQCVREGAGVASTGPIPPGLPGHAPEQEPYPYTPKKSQEILRKHGAYDRELVLLLPNIEGFIRTTGEVVQADGKKIGLNIRIRQAEWVTYRRLLREGEFDLAFRAWWADYPDGDNFLFPLFHSSQIGSSNFSRFNDPQIDRMIEQSQRMMEEEKRTALLRKIDDLIFKKAPAIFLWHRANYTVTQPWLHDYTVPRVFNGTRYMDEYIAPPKGAQR